MLFAIVAFVFGAAMLVIGGGELSSILLSLCALMVLLLFVIPMSPYVGNLRWRKYLIVVFLLCVYWSVAGASFLFFIQGIATWELALSQLQLLGVYSVSWAAGFIAFFAPQGVGVTEYVASHLIFEDSPIYFISVMAIFRVIVLIADMCAFVLSGATYFVKYR